MALSEKTKHQIERLKASARKFHEKVGRGFKGTAYATGTGVAGYFAASKVSEQAADSFIRKDYVFPVGLIAAGHFLKRKQYDVGTALCAIGGFLAANQYEQNKSKEELKGVESKPEGAKGFVERAGDAGWAMLDRAGDAGAFSGPGNTGDTTRQGPIQSPEALHARRDVRDAEYSTNQAMNLVDDTY